MPTITRRLFKMLLLLSLINARIDLNIPTNGSRFPCHFQHSLRCTFGQHERKRFKMQRASKVKCHVRAQVLKR
jgi:hypothetical protein